MLWCMVKLGGTLSLSTFFVKSVKYWLRILKMPDHRFPYKSYKMLLYLHEQIRKTWASSVCFLLYKYGFNHVWENQGVGDEKTFLKEFKNRLITEYKQELSDSIATNGRYLMYNTFKSSLTMSSFFARFKAHKSKKLFAENKIRCFTTEIPLVSLC